MWRERESSTLHSNHGHFHADCRLSLISKCTSNLASHLKGEQLTRLSSTCRNVRTETCNREAAAAYPRSSIISTCLHLRLRVSLFRACIECHRNHLTRSLVASLLLLNCVHHGECMVVVVVHHHHRVAGTFNVGAGSALTTWCWRRAIDEWH